jgi:hypothetical protein
MFGWINREHIEEKGDLLVPFVTLQLTPPPQ